jgi:hypothetical protein
MSTLAQGARGAGLPTATLAVRRINALAPRARGAWLLTAAFAAAYLIVAPASADLAAAAYRGELFSRAGFTLWDNAWYGGHHLLAYSLLAPALTAALGAQLLAALSMTAAAALFARIVDRHFAASAAALGAALFALGAGVNLFANRVPFDLGIAIGLAALALAVRSPPPRVRSVRGLGALLLAVLCALASPIAGAFLALAALAWALASPRVRRRLAPALLLAAIVPVALLVVVFPEGGTQPFDRSAFYPALAGVLVVAVLLPARERVLRTGALLYAAALIASFLIPSAVGGNADRLGALAAAPLAACALVPGWRADSRLRRLVLVVLLPALAYWQVNAAVADFAAGVSDRAEHASYYAPLLRELRRLGVGFGERPARIEVVATANHAEARFVGLHAMLARGWERQLDRERNALFYEESRPLTPARYRAWLDANAVSYVALPDAALDYSARAEAALVRVRVRSAGLSEIWSSAHWRLYAVLDPTPLAQPPAELQSVGTDSFALSVPRPGSYEVRIRYTPYWALASAHGCVSESADGFTDASPRAAGRLLIIIDFSIARVFDHGRRCR